MKAARYYPDDNLSIFSPLSVSKENEDGTVDLVDGKKVTIVTSCPVSSTPKLGHAVILEEKPPKEDTKKTK